MIRNADGSEWEPLTIPAVRQVDVATAYRRLVRAVEDACDAVGLSVAAAAAKVKDSDLRAMLDGRNGRRLPADVAAAIAEIVGPGHIRDAILLAIRELFGLVQPEVGEPYAARLERALLTFGQHGADMLARCRREARRG